MKITTPEGWRKGQTIFNFLEWLKNNGYGGNQNTRCADTFHIPDTELDKLYADFLAEYGKTKL